MGYLHDFQASLDKILNNQGKKRVAHRSLAENPKLRDSVKKTSLKWLKVSRSYKVTLLTVAKMCKQSTSPSNGEQLNMAQPHNGTRCGTGK